jgi:2-C-methyl-D-erythritol 4-phosphate cytidylyltransferase
MPPPSSLRCPAVVVAAGSSRRMGFDKLTAPLAGRPVLRVTLERLAACPAISEIIVVCPESRWREIPLAGIPTPIRRVDGGVERQDSVAAGVRATHPDSRWVAVHDGARPLVHPQDILRCLEAASLHRAASLARRVTDTVQRADLADLALETIPREQLWLMETPQIIERTLLLQALDSLHTAGRLVTDEVSAVATLGIRARLIEASHPNPKITTPADLPLAHALLLPP